MTSFLFWNLNKKPIHDAVSQLAHYYDVDVVLLAECVMPPSLLLKTLNKNNRVSYHCAPGRGGCRRIEVFTKFVSDFIRPVFEDSRWTIRHIDLPALPNILLTVVHIPSKLHYSESDQKSICVNLAQDIRFSEARVGHSNTVLVGDFNMNPFEDGMVSADGIHGIMSKSIAAQSERKVQNRSYRFFYNPMWNFFGDCTPFTPGTYYYRGSGYKTFFWNMFDNVLISSSLLERFDNKSLRIVTSTGLDSLILPSGEPNSRTFSDHLPIFFEINL